MTLLERTIDQIAVPRNGPGRPRKIPQRIVADKAYDSDRLRMRLLDRGIELIVPYRRSTRNMRYADGRKLRRYRRRWKVERTFAWLGNYRRLVVRWDRSIVSYRAFFHIACIMITMGKL